MEFVYDKGKCANKKEDPVMSHNNRRMKRQNPPKLFVGKMFFLSFSVTLCLILSISCAFAESIWAGMTAGEIVSRLTLKQKASQMVQPA